LVDAIKELLGVDELSDIFSPGTSPAKELSVDNLKKLRRVAKAVPNLLDLQERLIDECQYAGKAVPIRPKHMIKIRKDLEKEVCSAVSPRTTYLSWYLGPLVSILGLVPKHD
jgi:hypothetical protein